jgi:hypothetical protein
VAFLTATFISCSPLIANENNSAEMLIFDVDQDGRPNYRYIDRDDQKSDKNSCSYWY